MNLVVSSKKCRRTEAVDSLEHAFGLLKKDRLGPQKLGMQSLVTLTDAEASGSETALHCALAVLGAPNLGGGGEEPAFLRTLHYGWIVQLLQDRSWPGELKDEFSTMSTPHQQPVENVSGVLAGCKLSLLGEDCNARPSEQHKQEGAGASGQTTKPSWSGAAGVEEYHCGILRSLALRVLANSLDVVARRQSDMLKSILQVRCSHLVSDKFLSALVDDLAGAIRPPAVVEGTRLSSAHEAALAIRCLGVLAEHSDMARKFLLSDDVLESLEKARAAGRSTHEVLAAEAERTYSRLTEDARSC